MERDHRMSISHAAFIAWIRAYAHAIAENKDFLTQLDAAIGDADHGINMDRGFQAVAARLPTLENQDIGALSKSIGMVLLSTVGGASGPLYGTFFMQIGLLAAGKLELTLDDWVAALESAVDGVVRRGKASRGDKTMLDSLLPALDALKMATAAGASLSEALFYVVLSAAQGGGRYVGRL